MAMTRFLRFEIGGASVLLWVLLFLTPHLNIAELINVDAVKLFSVVLGSAVISVPLGNYVHQITDTVLNPFRKKRLFLCPRAVIAEINEDLGDKANYFRDDTFQAILVFSKAYTMKIEPNHSAPGKPAFEFKVDTLREEISNRYSYYYARMENGAVAPIFGVVFSLLIHRIFVDTNFILSEPSFSPWWVLVTAAFVAVAMLARIGRIFRELDDLEVALVKLQRPCWPEIATH